MPALERRAMLATYFPPVRREAYRRSFTTYSDEISVTPALSVITRASAAATINVRLAIMDFPKAAVIGVIGDVERCSS